MIARPPGGHVRQGSAPTGVTTRQTRLLEKSCSEWEAGSNSSPSSAWSLTKYPWGTT